MVASIRRVLELYDGDSVASVGLTYVEDDESTKILQMFQPVVLTEYSPQYVVGDGNCMYRSAALGLYGSQDHHVYLRLKVAMELLDHRSSYDLQSPDHARDKPSYDPFLIVSPFDKLLRDATTLGAWSELMHVYALSAALGVAIGSYLPPTSLLPCGNSIYTCTVAGCRVRSSMQPAFTVMWSSAVAPTVPTDFRVNHIVLLAKRKTTTTPTAEVQQETPQDDPAAASLCVACTRVVTARQYAVDCDVCGDWCHIRCQKGRPKHSHFYISLPRYSLPLLV